MKWNSRQSPTPRVALATSRRDAVRFGSVAVGVASGVFGPLSAARARPARGAIVAVAASLRFVAEDLLAAWRLAQPGSGVALVFGATGTLVRQIENGAPFAVLLTADVPMAARLSQAGVATTAPFVFGRGRLALVAPRGAKLGVTSALPLTDADESLLINTAVRAASTRRIAIADPEVAPFGVAARTALQDAGVWDVAQPKLILGESVGRAAQLCALGAADVGLIADSLTQVPRIKAALQSVTLRYAPQVDHAAVMMSAVADVDEAQRFFQFLKADAAAEIYQRHGLRLPARLEMPVEQSG